MLILKFSPQKNRRGESFIEVLIALFVVSLAIVVALNLLLSTTDLTTANRNFLVAENLADEGIEAIYNLIATNIIKYGIENSESCWLTYPTDVNKQLFTADQCENNQIVNINSPTLADSYLLRDYSSLDLHWDLDRLANSTLNLEDDPENAKSFLLYTSQLDDTDPDSTIKTYYTSEETNNTPSSFYRSITLTLDPILTNEVTAQVKVQWREANRVRQVEKAVTYNRDNFSQ